MNVNIFFNIVQCVIRGYIDCRNKSD